MKIIKLLFILLALPLLISAQDQPANPLLKKYAGNYYFGEDGKKDPNPDKYTLTADGNYSCRYLDENKKSATYTGTWTIEGDVIRLYRGGDTFDKGDPETYTRNAAGVFYAGPYYLKKVVVKK